MKPMKAMPKRKQIPIESSSDSDDNDEPQTSSSSSKRKDFFCYKCKKSINGSIWHWRRHWKNVHGSEKKKFNCPFCDRRFSTKQKLKDHISNHHNSPDNSSDPEISHSPRRNRNPFILDECEEDGREGTREDDPISESESDPEIDETLHIEPPRPILQGPSYAIVPGPSLEVFKNALLDHTKNPMADIPENYYDEDFIQNSQQDRLVVLNDDEEIEPQNSKNQHSRIKLVDYSSSSGDSHEDLDGPIGGTRGEEEENNLPESNEVVQINQQNEKNVEQTNPRENEEQEEEEPIGTQKKTKQGVSGNETHKHLIGFRPFAKLSQNLSFFACLATYFACIRGNRPLANVRRFQTSAKELYKKASAWFSPTQIAKKNGKLRWDMVPLIARSFKMNIQVYNERRAHLTEENSEKKLPILNLLITEKGHYCIIKNLKNFRQRFECPDCKGAFASNQKLSQHILKRRCSYQKFFDLNPDANEMDYLRAPMSTYMVKHHYKGGKTTPNYGIGERLATIGIHIEETYEFNSFFATSDIESYLHGESHECMEGKDLARDGAQKSNLKYLETHKPSAVAVISNLGGEYSRAKCFIDLNGSGEFLEVYVKYLLEMSDQAFERNVVNNQDILNELRFTKEKVLLKGKHGLVHQIEQLENDIQKYMRTLPILFYNMTYDISCLVREAGFAWLLYQAEGVTPRALKNINKWIVLSTKKLKFLDVCSYGSGKSPLTEFLNSYEVPDHGGKLFFAYQELNGPKDMWKELPIPYESFWSDLKQANVLEMGRKKYDSLFETGMEEKAILKQLKRTSVPQTGREEYQGLVEFCESRGMKYLWHYLGLYCCMDIVGLLVAVEKMKKSFMDLTQIDMFSFCTLPALSYNWALKHMAEWETDEDGLKFVVKLDEEAFRIIEEGIKGGSSTVLKRLSIVDYTKIRSHQIPPEQQQLVKNIVYFDFNMLYGSSAYSNMPVMGNFSTRKKSENFKMQQVNGRGLLALSWLQYQSKIIEQKPMRTILHNNSEMTIMLKNANRARLDGWITVSKNQKGQMCGYSYEFHGSVVHSHPDIMSEEDFQNGLNPINGKPNKQVYEETLARDKLIRQHDLVEKHTVMWEHEWQKIIREDSSIRSFVQNCFKAFAPDPIKKEMTWEELLELICQEKVHGVVKCSLETPEHLIEKFSIYPPFWVHRELGKEDCCETERAYAEKYHLLTSQSKTLCHELQVEDTVTTTDMLRFYVNELGLKCTNISIFIQFRGAGKPLKEWADKCIEHREQARLNNEPIKGKTAKLFLNTFFGSSILKIERRKSVSFVLGKKVNYYINRPGFEGMFVAGPPQNPDAMYEVQLKKMNIQQTSSKQIGMWILQISKLHLLNFIYNVADKYLKKECWEINATDTDSVLLSLACESADVTAIAKSEMKEELQAKYDTIFVTKPEDAHVPLLMKVEKEAKIFIGLAAKTYIMVGNDPFHKQASKGISATKENEDVVSLVNYMTTLFDTADERKKAIIRGIRTDREKSLRTYELYKSGLSRLAPKVGFFPHCRICPFPRDLKDDPELLERIYPFCCEGVCFESAWAKILELSRQFPQMQLRLE